MNDADTNRDGGAAVGEGEGAVQACDVSCDTVTPDVTKNVLENVTETEPAAQACPPVPCSLPLGQMRYGVTATGGPLGASHYLADSSVCGDLVAALPASVLVAGRSEAAGGVAVDMASFLDAVVEGCASLKGREGIAEAASLPMWAVCRLLGTFPVLDAVMGEAMDSLKYEVEASLFKAAIGVKAVHTRRRSKKKLSPNGKEMVETESDTDVLEKSAVMDVAAAKFVLSNRMKGRYKDDGGTQQAVQINFVGAEAAL